MKKIILLWIILVGFSKHITSQSNPDKIKFEVKPTDTVYIIMSDTISDLSREYIKVYREYWNFSKIKFVSYEEKSFLEKPGNWFFGYSTYKSTTTQNNGTSGTYEIIDVSLYMDLYTYELEKNKKGESFLKNRSLTGFSLQIKDKGYFQWLIPGRNFSGPYYKLDTTRYDFYGKLSYWGPGVLKNQIQKIDMYAKAKYIPYFDEAHKFDTPKEVSDLKNNVLYVPEECFSKFDSQEDIAKMFKDYSYEYDIVSTRELNEKILQKEKIYYLTCTFGVSDKSIRITNSKTGRFVYRDGQDSSHKLKKKDIKKIMKAINGD